MNGQPRLTTINNKKIQDKRSYMCVLLFIIRLINWKPMNSSSFRAFSNSQSQLLLQSLSLMVNAQEHTRDRDHAYCVIYQFNNASLYLIFSSIKAKSQQEYKNNYKSLFSSEEKINLVIFHDRVWIGRSYHRSHNGQDELRPLRVKNDVQLIHKLIFCIPHFIDRIMRHIVCNWQFQLILELTIIIIIISFLYSIL